MITGKKLIFYENLLRKWTPRKSPIELAEVDEMRTIHIRKTWKVIWSGWGDVFERFFKIHIHILSGTCPWILLVAYGLHVLLLEQICSTWLAVRKFSVFFYCIGLCSNITYCTVNIFCMRVHSGMCWRAKRAWVKLKRNDGTLVATFCETQR